MANDYFNNTRSFTPGTSANGNEVDDKFDAVSAGFDLIGDGTTKAIKLTNADVVGSQEITGDAVTRANKVVGFDQDGVLTLKVAGATYRGDWAGATFYRTNDIVKDAAGAVGLNNVYICSVEHTSANLASDIANWALMIDVGAVEAARVAAEAAQSAAEAAETGAEAAEATATSAASTASTAATNAQNAQSYAEEWANKAENSLVSVPAGGNGVDEYSARHWAAKAEEWAGISSGDITDHVNDTTTHGVTGNLVGTIDAQTLTNKTISAANNTIAVSVAGVTATALNAALTEMQASIDALEAGTIGSIGEINDVVVGGMADNEVLAYNSATGKWINQTANEAGLATSNHTHASSAITDFTSAAAAVVTYENLNSNGDVGTGSSQVARGNHNHDGVYAVEGHTHAQYVLGDGTDHPAAVIIDVAAFDFILRDQSLGTTNFFWRDGGALKLGGADTIVQFRGDVQFGDSAGNISALFDADGNFHIGAAAVAVDYGYALNVVGSNSSTALVRNAGSSSTAGLRLSGSRTGNGNAPSQIELGNREGGSTDTALAILEAIRQGTNSLDLAFFNGGSGLSPTETLRIPASGAAMYGPAVGVRQVGYADSAINAAYTVEGDLITVTLTGVQVGSKVTLIGMAKLDFNANTDAYLNITNASNVALASEIMRNGSTATYGEFQTISVTAQATSPGTGTVTFKLRGYGTSVDFLWYSLMAIEHK